jgi:hypothetical protein
MKRALSTLIVCGIIALAVAPTVTEANSGDFDGGVAIGSSYAGVDAAPTNGLIIQGNVGLGITDPQSQLVVAGSSSPYMEVATGDHSSGKTLILQYDTSDNVGRIQAYNWATSAVQNLSFETLGGDVGIGTLTPSYTLHVNGSVAGTSAYNNLSDVRFKTDITPIAYGLDTVMKLHPVGFNWRDQDQKWKRQHQLGLIAQEVEPLVPDVVTTSDDEMQTKSIAYSSLIPVLIKAIQEQQQEISVLERKVAGLDRTTTAGTPQKVSTAELPQH